jgi:glycerol uptake facilitator-like aquaporin
MALLVETVITAGLVFCIFAFTDAHNKVAEGAAPVLIGTRLTQNKTLLSFQFIDGFSKTDSGSH